MKKIKNKRILNPGNYVNPETGETMDSELGTNTRVVATSDSDKVTVPYKTFVNVNDDFISYIMDTLKHSDVVRLIKMSSWLKTDFNIVFNHTVPHTLESLSGALGISKDELTRLVNRLVKKGLMAYVVCAPSGYIQKIYMVSPYITKKRKEFNKEVIVFFKKLDLKKEKEGLKPNNSFLEK